jgi:2-polyprenyl-3-methyl-5-hydroxy-6-metoxy-1,4-benzoquinol methylase
MDKKQFYEKIDVTRMSADEKRRADIMLKLLDGFAPKNLLDVGGMPEMTEYFANTLKIGGIGINISEKVVNSYKGANKGLKFVVGDAENGLPGGKFDLIICGELLEHLQDPDAFIEALKPRMSENGRLLLTVPNLASLFNRVSLLFGWQPRGINPSHKMLLNPFTKYDYNWGHISMFTHYSVRKFLEANGFKVLAVKGTYGGPKSNLLRALLSARTSFSEQIIILARLKA